MIATFYIRHNLRVSDTLNLCFMLSSYRIMEPAAKLSYLSSLENLLFWKAFISFWGHLMVKTCSCYICTQSKNKMLHQSRRTSSWNKTSQVLWIPYKNWYVLSVCTFSFVRNLMISECRNFVLSFFTICCSFMVLDFFYPLVLFDLQSFWVDNQTRKQQDEFISLDGDSVPLYDRGFALGLVSEDGQSKPEG